MTIRVEVLSQFRPSVTIKWIPFTGIKMFLLYHGSQQFSRFLWHNSNWDEIVQFRLATQRNWISIPFVMNYILFFFIGSRWRLKKFSFKSLVISVWEFGENGRRFFITVGNTCEWTTIANLFMWNMQIVKKCDRGNLSSDSNSDTPKLP